MQQADQSSGNTASLSDKGKKAVAYIELAGTMSADGMLKVDL